MPCAWFGGAPASWWCHWLFAVAAFGLGLGTALTACVLADAAFASSSSGGGGGGDGGGSGGSGGGGGSGSTGKEFNIDQQLESPASAAALPQAVNPPLPALSHADVVSPCAPLPPSPPPPDGQQTLPVTRYWGRSKYPLNVSGQAMAPPVPELYRRFDWLFHDVASWTHTLLGSACRSSSEPLLDPAVACSAGVQITDPRTVWVQPSPAKGLAHFEAAATALKRMRVPRDGCRILVVAGEDTRLSARLNGTMVLDLVRRLQPWFRRVYYEGLDVPAHIAPGVQPMPIGLTEMYYRAEGGEAAVLRAAAEPEPTKTAEVLAAFGEFWPWLRDSISSRREADTFCERHRGEPWLRCDLVSPGEWWPTLSTFRFLLCPTGRGVQSPKWLEALLAGALPILQSAPLTSPEPAFLGLRAAGWPMVVVDSWDAVASESNRDAWWRELSPKLRALRASGALSVDGYMRYLRTGSLQP